MGRQLPNGQKGYSNAIQPYCKGFQSLFLLSRQKGPQLVEACLQMVALH